MATAPQSRRLNLTRDQLAAFLTDQQQIRQFELLFSVVDEIQEIVGIDFLYQADNAAATANEALAQINALSKDTAVDEAVLNAKVQQLLDIIPRLVQDTKINDAVLNAKVQQTLDSISNMAKALELLALAPVAIPPIAITGATGIFTTADIPPQTVTVVNGIITSIV